MKKQEEYVQICPQCGSADVGADFTNPGALAFAMSSVLRCSHCGHTGTFFPSIPKSKVHEPLPVTKVKNRELVGKEFMRGNLRMELLVSGGMFVLLGIVILSYSIVGGIFTILFGAMFLAGYVTHVYCKNKWYSKAIFIILVTIYVIGLGLTLLLTSPGF